jgi:hypothetical protein
MPPIEISAKGYPTPADKKRLKSFLPTYTTCKAVVEKVLREIPRCRGSDRQLIKEVERLCRVYSLKQPSHETITRARRRFNEAGLYLPSERTQSRRKNRERTFRQSAREGLL